MLQLNAKSDHKCDGLVLLQFEPNHSDLRGEKQRSLDILHKLQTHQPLLDADKSANRLIAAEQQQKW